MATQKLEYDASLGGRVTLPTHVSTYHYASGALKEIKSLIAEAQLPTNSKLIFQTLPKHMRRRAMSHHPKRLPRKYRAAHKSQMGKAGNQPVPTKRPSRKYRRRPKNLMREYVRRQRKHSWLETHIWHAKRFHMIDRWGYRLPYASCDKTYRACYRASTEHCLLQDMSFYSCVQLEASQELLLAGFKRLTSPSCGLGIGAKTFVGGRREGSIELFADGQYPLGALQRASFMWRCEEQQMQRTLWLWLHPAGAEATVAQLINVFQLKSSKQQTLPLPTDTTDKCKEQPLRFWTHTKAFERHRTYTNADESLKMRILKQEFNRFRLTGARAQRVLAASLRAYRPDANHTHWLAEALKEPDSQLTAQLESQADFAKAALQLSSPNELLSNMIVGLNVVDPRLQRPRVRSKASQAPQSLQALQPPQAVGSASSSAKLLLTQPADLAASCLWQAELRERLGQTMLTTYQYEQLRQQHAIVPGQSCAFEQELQPLPLLLVQRPGSQQPQYKRLGYGAGWDVIAPARYGMALWLTFIMWGARPGGLREFESVAREAAAELHLPDTVPGVQLAAVAATERRARYFRLPPNKRCNYRKLAVISPFSAPWEQLVRDWQDKSCTTGRGYYVLRDRVLLERLDDCLRHGAALPAQLPQQCLIQIQLHLQSRGHLKDNALICLPTTADWKHQRRQFKHNDHAPVHSEPPQPDLNERLRKELRVGHKRLLKRLRARRVREKRKLQETATRRVHIRAAQTATLVREQFDKMSSLWLPIDPSQTRDSVRRQCSREVFGYVSSAAFSFIEATVCGVGYITPAGLCKLLEGGSGKSNGKCGQLPLCLVRDADSRDYRFARFQVNRNVTAPPF